MLVVAIKLSDILSIIEKFLLIFEPRMASSFSCARFWHITLEDMGSSCPPSSEVGAEVALRFCNLCDKTNSGEARSESSNGAISTS